MGRGKQLTNYEKGRIDGLSSIGISNRQIASTIKRSAKVVNNYVQDKDGYGQKKSPGRPMLLSDRDKRVLSREIRQTGASVKDVMAKTGVPGSRWTSWRAVKSTGNVEYCMGQRRPAWKEHHLQARLEFATSHITWTTEWDKVVFSDEKKWNLDGPDGCKYYWHDFRDEPHWFSKRVQGGASVMTWGGFVTGGLTQLKIKQGRLNSKDYQDLLSDALLPRGVAIGGPGWIFQQDNAPIHVSHSSMQWLQEHGVRTINWPALSPDLNPIENIWGIMVRKVYANGRQFQNVTELKNAIIAAWGSIRRNLREKLSRSMHGRCIKVLQANGGSCKH
jgi:transposase